MRHPVVEEDLARICRSPLPWERLAGKTVLVTGAAGLLPAYMVETLLYLNEQDAGQRTTVLALARDRRRAEARFAHYLGRNDLRLIVQDVCEPLRVSTDVHHVIHAASAASPKHYGRDPIGTLAPNVFGTSELLGLAREKGAEGFLFFSSGEVYGQLEESQVPTPEDVYGRVDPTDVRSCYAESKRMGETLCVSWFHQHGVPAKIVRPFHTYGPGMRLDDGRVFADFVADVVCGRDIVMKSDGSARRAFCYLADATIGFFTVLLCGAPATPYNIGNDQGEMSVLELARLLVGLFPEKGLRVVEEAREVGRDYLPSKIHRNCPDITRARGLGWAPEVGVAEGFERTVRSFG